MRRFVTLNCLVDCSEIDHFPSDAVQSLRRAVLAPAVYTPKILQALQRINFQFHRTCSFCNADRDCNAPECDTLLMFWADHSDSRVTMSLSASSCSSIHMSPTSGQSNAQAAVANPRDRDLRTTAQQTEISCRSPGAMSPVNLLDAEALRARLADSLTFSSPPSSLTRSTSILGSVCALLLNKQGAPVVAKVSSLTGSHRSDNICRICFGGESAERLVRPCSCRGTIAAVHRTCLERWLLQAATSYCELCRHHYIVTRSHKWSWLRSLAEWARSGRGRALAADAWRGAALGAASVLGTARALHACDQVLQAGARHGGGAALAANLFSSLLIGIIGALNGLLTTWMLLKIQEHQMSWQTWRDSTLHVHVTLADEGVSARSSATVVADGHSTSDRSTNIADPFMVALPFTFPES